jgi:predicted nucleotidyltransferase
LQDVDRDGDVDLLLHYETQETGIDAGDTKACLTGLTSGGIHVYGCDAIRTE